MMTDKVKAFIAQHGLLNSDRLQLVALSGGADSVCLLMVLLRLGYRVDAVHCNFMLRGEESNRDELFVRNLCQRLGVPLHIVHFDTRTYASLHRVSIEMAARQLRYAYFEQLRCDINAERIVVAHHQDDSVETLLMNLIRGTGLRGLTGIKPLHGHVARPLLCVCRQEIEQWLSIQGQDYITDSSNLVPDVLRNKLRLSVIPQLRQVMASGLDGILTTARRLAEAEQVYAAAISKTLDELVSDDSIAISSLLQQPSPEALLYEWLSPLGFTSGVVESIAYRLSQIQAGRHWHSQTHLLYVSNGRLFVAPQEPELPILVIPEPGVYIYNNVSRLRLVSADGAVIERQSDVACLDVANVQFPLTLRPVQTGDRFRPYGMKGTKLVSDFLTDLKVPLPRRRSQLILTDAQGRILWLVSRRPDARFCVTPNTRQTLVITFVNGLAQK